jgi:hypothetical protein
MAMAERASEKQYLVVDQDGKGHLPVRDSPDGPLDHHLMGAAWAALHGGYRGKKYQGPNAPAALARLKALYQSEGMELPEAQAADGQGGRWADGKGATAHLTTSPLHHLPTSPSAPRFFVLLAEAPATGLIRIPIAITGKWKGAEKEFSIGIEDLEDIRANFAKKPTGEINVDYEHASEVPFGTGGPVLSAGRIVRLDAPEKYGTGDSGLGTRQNPPSPASSPQPRFILWGWFMPTERARALIQAREYRYISPAIRWGTKDKITGKTQGTTLTSVALVNKPFLEDLPAIQDSGSGIQDSGSGIPDSDKAAGPKSRTRGSAAGPESGTCATHVLAGETADGQKVFVSLGQLHVPGPVNRQVSGARCQVSGPEVSVAFKQPGKSESRTQKSETKETDMAAKSLKLKCLTDADLDKHGLPASHKGKIGVFDGEEHIGTAEWPEGWQGPNDGDEEEGDGTAIDAAAFASEVGTEGRPPAEIVARVNRGHEARQDQFAVLAEAIHEGHINLVEAGKLADAGRVRFSTILQAQDAERKVEAAVRAGKVLPRNRTHALRLALSDAAGFAALVEQAVPVVDLRTRGHAGGGEQPTAQQSLMAEVNAYAKENKCSVSEALSEVTKLKPDLWRAYSEEIVTAVEAAEPEED